MNLEITLMSFRMTLSTYRGMAVCTMTFVSLKGTGRGEGISFQAL